MHYWSFN